MIACMLMPNRCVYFNGCLGFLQKSYNYKHRVFVMFDRGSIYVSLVWSHCDTLSSDDCLADRVSIKDKWEGYCRRNCLLLIHWAVGDVSCIHTSTPGEFSLLHVKMYITNGFFSQMYILKFNYDLRYFIRKVNFMSLVVYSYYYSTLRWFHRMYLHNKVFPCYW